MERDYSSGFAFIAFALFAQNCTSPSSADIHAQTKELHRIADATEASLALQREAAKPKERAP